MLGQLILAGQAHVDGAEQHLLQNFRGRPEHVVAEQRNLHLAVGPLLDVRLEVLGGDAARMRIRSEMPQLQFNGRLRAAGAERNQNGEFV